MGIRRWQIPNFYHFCQNLTMADFWLVGICWLAIDIIIVITIIVTFLDLWVSPSSDVVTGRPFSFRSRATTFILTITTWFWRSSWVCYFTPSTSSQRKRPLIALAGIWVCGRYRGLLWCLLGSGWEFFELCFRPKRSWPSCPRRHHQPPSPPHLTVLVQSITLNPFSLSSFDHS